MTNYSGLLISTSLQCKPLYLLLDHAGCTKCGFGLQSQCKRCLWVLFWYANIQIQLRPSIFFVNEDSGQDMTEDDINVVLECLQIVASWGNPSSLQKSTSKDVIRIVDSKMRHEKTRSLDALLRMTNAIVKLVREANTKINPAIFELLPLLMSKVVSTEKFEERVFPSQEATSGAVESATKIYPAVKSTVICDYFLDRLLACKWRSDNLVDLIVMFRDIGGLSSKRIEEVVEKTTTLLPEASQDEVPAMLYQLLLLGRGREGNSPKESANSMGATFRGIIDYFATLENMESSSIGTTGDEMLARTQMKLESQSISHIILALNYNKLLADEFVKHAKKLAKTRLPRFVMMILLNLSESFKFHQIVIRHICCSHF